MRIRRARQMLKSLADDTRLRIVNLLDKQSMNVSELCQILSGRQSNISKHLARLRLTGLVSDKREGLNVYYFLCEPENKAHKELVNVVTRGLSGLEVFKRDVGRIKRIKTKNTKNKQQN